MLGVKCDITGNVPGIEDFYYLSTLKIPKSKIFENLKQKLRFNI
jgi:hypothetical protein